jgi:hypothetical protein
MRREGEREEGGRKKEGRKEGKKEGRKGKKGKGRKAKDAELGSHLTHLQNGKATAKEQRVKGKTPGS